MSKKKNIKSKRKTVNPNSDINVPNTISFFKVKCIFVISILLIIALIVRLVFLQFVDGEHLLSLATSQQTLTETLSAKRGTIYDSTGQTLAISYDADKVYFNPADIEKNNLEILANGLANILELDYVELLNKMTEATSRILVASDVNQEKVDEIKSWKSNLEKKDTKDRKSVV